MILLLVACAEPGRHARTCPLSEPECALREQLGVPLDAPHVLMFGQTSHLDIDWQKTFDAYYDDYVETVFFGADTLLQNDDRAYYGIAEMAFLQEHLRRHPDAEDSLRTAVKRGALRIIGGGMTSPDTMLPETELLARDYLDGARFADESLGARASAAWLPDSFGHSGTAPDVLVAAGFSSVAFSRLDGALTAYEQFTKADQPLKPGSHAAFLAAAGSADFRWRGVGGATILAHYMAQPRLYCAGDNIDYQEDLEVPGGHLGPFMGGDTDFTDARVDQYFAELAAYSPTPYAFVPVGCDFASPKAQLISYLDGYNERCYKETGVWAVAAPFDDYAALIAPHADELPEIQGELSPYYTGFYGSRPGVKRAVRDAARPFFTAEPFAAVLGEEGAALHAAAAPAMSLLTRADHHDFVTGTANDDVTNGEQLPLLADAEREGNTYLSGVMDALAHRIPPTEGSLARVLAINASGATRDDLVTVSLPSDLPAFYAEANGSTVPYEQVSPDGGKTVLWRFALDRMPPFGWRSIEIFAGERKHNVVSPTVEYLGDDGLPRTENSATHVVLSNQNVRATFTKASRFYLTSLIIDEREAIASPSFGVTDYVDDGGLWRLGNEMDGCGLELVEPSADLPEETTYTTEESVSRVTVAFASPDGTVREATLDSGSSSLDLAITTSAAEGTTRTVSWAFVDPVGAALLTSAPGGSIERPKTGLYAPTFWPAVDWVKVGKWAVFLRQSTGVTGEIGGGSPLPGGVEIIAARDARSEKCDVEGGTGSDTERHRIEWRIARVSSTTDAENQAQAYNRPVVAARVGPGPADGDLPAEASLASLTGAGTISGIKPAEDGDGVVVRLLLNGSSTLSLSSLLPAGVISEADLLERGGSAEFDRNSLLFDAETNGSITTLRVRP